MSRKPESGGAPGPAPGKPKARPATPPKAGAAPPSPPPLALLVHELRTPLSAISTLAEIIRDEHLGPLGTERYRGYAADIFDNAAHALSVLAALTSSGPGDPLGAIEKKAVDVNALAAGVGSSLAPLASSVGVELKTRLAPGLASVASDARALRQIVLNLMTNAIKASGAGGRVVLSTEASPEGGVVIEVSDEGRGMSKSTLARAQAATGNAPLDGALRPKASLGLGVAQALTLAIGGTLEFDSAPGRGTRARLSLA